MPTNKERGPHYPTPRMVRWLDECGRALATADADGAEDHHVALILGAYFNALHEALESSTSLDPHERLCTEEAGRFLGMLRGVAERRTHIAQERVDTLRRAGLVVFPTLIGEDEP